MTTPQMKRKKNRYKRRDLPKYKRHFVVFLLSDRFTLRLKVMKKDKIVQEKIGYSSPPP